MTYKEIINLETLDNFTPEQAVSLIGIIFENGRELQNVEDIKIGIDLAKKQDLEDFSNDDKMIFHYNLANGWSYLQQLTQPLNSKEFWNFELKELDEQIINLRLALHFSKNSSNNLKKCEILTNLGSLFGHIGRFSEAQLYWNLALKIDSTFAMAIGNIGFGLVHYSKILYDNGQQILFYQFGYKYLKNAINSNIYEDAKNGFQNIIGLLESKFSKEFLLDIQDLKDFPIGDSNLEREYRNWCLDNYLFLNPLNDFIIENIAANDCLLLPSITLKYNKTPVYQTIFNQIKQEFVSARYMLFEGINNRELHFSDKDNIQIDTLDYAVYSYNSEKTKTAFRLCYSILDKIGYLINDYLKLKIKPDRVTFRGLWTVYDKKNKTKKLNDKIEETQNWAFRGLYWLSKDLYEKDLSFSNPIEPDAKKLALIRNFIEHKSFKIIEFGESGLFDNGLTYVIEREEFENKTLKLFKLIRASMIYLSLGINLEEKKKEHTKPTIPIEFIKLDDEFKR